MAAHNSRFGPYRRTLVLVALAGVLVMVALGCRSADISTTVDDEDTSDWVWSEARLRFTLGPRVCDGVLSVKGTLLEEAAFPYSTDDVEPFILYLDREAEAGALWDSLSESGTADPVLVFLEPLATNVYYLTLDESSQIATLLQADHGVPTFELVSDVPTYVSDNPDHYVLGVWGYRGALDPWPEILGDRVLQGC